MTDRSTANWIVALEEARAQLEVALSANASWRALSRATSRASRAQHQRALAGNPVYRAWDLVRRALDEMHPQRARHGEPGAAAPADTAGSDGGAARAQTQRGATRRRISLREVLASIRSDAALDSGEPAAPVTGRVATAPAAPRPATAAAARTAPPDPDEAAVSFIAREPHRPPQAPQADEGRPHDPEDVGCGAAEATSDPDADHGAEAEVVIVPRPG